MSHLIKIHTVCKFSYFRLWYLKSRKKETSNNSYNNTYMLKTQYDNHFLNINMLIFVVLEIHAINETPGYLRRVIHDTGLKLKSTAVCTHIHRLRYGHFTVDHALLRQQWTVPDIANNVVKCRKLLTPEKLFTNANIGGEGMVRTHREHTTEDLLKIMRKKKMKSQTLS